MLARLPLVVDRTLRGPDGPAESAHPSVLERVQVGDFKQNGRALDTSRTRHHPHEHREGSVTGHAREAVQTGTRASRTGMPASSMHREPKTVERGASRTLRAGTPEPPSQPQQGEAMSSHTSLTEWEVRNMLELGVAPGGRRPLSPDWRLVEEWRKRDCPVHDPRPRSPLQREHSAPKIQTQRLPRHSDLAHAARVGVMAG